jgi:hypothetical protein
MMLEEETPNPKKRGGEGEREKERKGLGRREKGRKEKRDRGVTGTRVQVSQKSIRRPGAVRLNGREREARGVSEGSRRTAKGVEREMRIETKADQKGPKGAPEITLREDNQTARRVVRKKRRSRGNREKALKKEKSLNWAKRRARNREESKMESLVITLERLSPADEDDQAARVKGNIPPTKMPERIKGGRRRRSKIRNAEHSKKRHGEGRNIKRSQREGPGGPEKKD